MKKDTILLVDDDDTLRMEFKQCFEEYDIIEAGNGEEALKILSKPHQIDLVLLDFRMPGKNGLEVLKLIKKSDPEVSVIMFTGYASKDSVLDAFRSKVDDFIEKPLKPELVRAVIEKTLSKKRKEPEDDSLDLKGRILKVKRFLEQNYRKKTSLEDAAKIGMMSSKYLSRVYKDIVGMGFNEHRRRLRIEESKTLLKTTGYSVDQISYKIGYENAESFIRQFKKFTRTTPSGYRKSKKR